MNFIKEKFSLADYREILENYNLKFEKICNLKIGMKIGKETAEAAEAAEEAKAAEAAEAAPKSVAVVREAAEAAPKSVAVVREAGNYSEKDIEKDTEKEAEKKELCIFRGYCIYNANMYQKVSRWWNNEDRDKTFMYLDKDFTKFVKYLDLIKYTKPSFNYKHFGLLNNINKLINRLIPGLYNLKKTYIEENKIAAKIDSIILTLIDFKAEISKSNCH